ncbi:hypothetical protein QVD17_10627 [Tagetes erecta]|uniref:Uncharacterized protein n=1 Tax=Tagetes erecta TaxID=13708 RepID=A0AAD8P6D0_TARER|nr:hypothetical protein QVD17_10627 [Tagetes erecta]
MMGQNLKSSTSFDSLINDIDLIFSTHSLIIEPQSTINDKTKLAAFNPKIHQQSQSLHLLHTVGRILTVKDTQQSH